MTTYNGRCHCGETEWTVKLADEGHILCHCDACKILGGGEYTMNQMADQNDFKLTKGTLKNYTYKGDSGKDTICYYCPTCTAHPYHHQTVNGPKYVIRTGLLQDSKKFPVPAELYDKDRLEWQPQIAKTIFKAGPE